MHSRAVQRVVLVCVGGQKSPAVQVCVWGGGDNIKEGDQHGSRAPVVAWGAIKNQASPQCKLPADLSDTHWGHS